MKHCTPYIDIWGDTENFYASPTSQNLTKHLFFFSSNFFFLKFKNFSSPSCNILMVCCWRRCITNLTYYWNKHLHSRSLTFNWTQLPQCNLLKLEALWHRKQKVELLLFIPLFSLGWIIAHFNRLDSQIIAWQFTFFKYIQCKKSFHLFFVLFLFVKV